MRLRKYLLPVAVIFMVMTFFSCTYNPARYFPLQEGDEWTYAYTLNGNTMSPLEVFIGDTEWVNGVEAIRYNMSSPTPNEYDYYCFTTRDPEGLKQPKIYWATFGIYIVFDPPRMVFPANFKLGEVYEQPYGYTQYSIDDDSIVGTFTGSETVTLESIEEVTVPAGTFNCLKVVTSTYSQNGDWVEGIDEITWYSRKVGMVKHDITFYQLNHPVQEDMETAITHDLSDYNGELP